MNRIKQFIGALLFLAAFSQPATAQYSLNIVGYINLAIHPGENLIANQLYNTNHSLGYLFPNVPAGSTFTKWNPVTQQYLPVSTYTEGGGWSLNYDLNPTEGALFNSPSLFTNTFVGELASSNGEPVLNPPSLGDGIFLVSCSVPFSPATFQQVIGRPPAEGESVRWLDPLSQNYFQTTFRSGAWDNGTPGLDVGESAFFTLGTAALVPEPGTTAMIGVGLVTAGFVLRRKRARR